MLVVVKLLPTLKYVINVNSQKSFTGHNLNARASSWAFLFFVSLCRTTDVFFPGHSCP